MVEYLGAVWNPHANVLEKVEISQSINQSLSQSEFILDRSIAIHNKRYRPTIKEITPYFEIYKKIT